MKNDMLWKLFTETGDPVCWLYCRAAEKNKDRKKRAGHSFAGELKDYICLKRQEDSFCARCIIKKPTGF